MLFALLMAAGLGTAPAEARVSVIALSDYHSHALPFRSEGRPDQGGIARAIGYIEKARAAGPTLVLSGGDMLNQGVPAWSDEFHCVEWPWLNGLVDAMALGNHDLDYGPGVFDECRRSASYPVLAANLVREDGTPFLQARGKPYLVAERAGVKIGIVAVAGDDFSRLVVREHLPPETHWAPALPAARKAVGDLRSIEKVDAVIFIGHEAREDDERLAREVPGIDLVLGTHSHHESGLVSIPGTPTRYIAPYQYLAYLSEVQLVFAEHRLVRIEGGLVRMDASQPEDPEVARKVKVLQGRLVASRPGRFQVIGTLRDELSDVDVQKTAAPIGTWATEACRRAAGTHVFFSTASSFRAGLPPGPVTLEDLLAVVPYPNRIAVAEMTGQQLVEWLKLSLARRGSDGFSQSSGLLQASSGEEPGAVQVLRDPANPGEGYVPLDSQARYLVGTTDFQAYVAAGYRELFAAARNPHKTDIDVLAALRRALAEP